MSTKELAIQYDAEVKRELLPAPKFEGIYWQGLINEQELVGAELVLHGERRQISVIGFQGSESGGKGNLHLEKNGEYMFPVSGEIEVWMWNGRKDQDRVANSYGATGPLTTEQIARAKYVLAVASERDPDLSTPHEYLVLNMEVDDKMYAVMPIWTRPGWQHSAEIAPGAVYMVLKHEPVQVS